MQLKCQPLCASYVTAVSFNVSYNECLHSITLLEVCQSQTEKYPLQPGNSGTPATWLLQLCICNCVRVIYKNAAVIFHTLTTDIQLQVMLYTMASDNLCVLK